MHKKNLEKSSRHPRRSTGSALFDVLSVKRKKITRQEFISMSSNTDEAQFHRFAARTFSHLSLYGLMVYLIVVIISTLIISLLNVIIPLKEALSSISSNIYLDVSTLTFVIFAPPILYAFLSYLPKICPEKAVLSLKQFVLLFLASWSLCYVGNYLGIISGSMLDYLFYSSTTPPTAAAINGMSTIKVVLYFVIFPAIFEELVFRKIIIDRSAYFGQTASAFFSALFFALYHMNIYQFFYAFLAGYLFSIVYIKTGRIVYCMLLHGMVNTFGTLLPLLLSSESLMITSIYNMASAAIAIAGGIVIILNISYAKNHNGRFVQKSPGNEAKDDQARQVLHPVHTVICNPGMMVFIIFTLINFIAYFF